MAAKKKVAKARGPRKKSARAARLRRSTPTAPSSSAETAALVRMLADRRAIEDTLIAYGHALDARDYARLRECFEPDARVKYGDADWLTGPDEAGRYCARALDPLDVSQHRFSSIDVQLDGDRARSTTYLAAEHVKNGERYTVGGHYLDEWERTPKGWRIAKRQLVATWTDGDPAVLGGVSLSRA